MIKIIEQKDKWKSVLESIQDYDFYHTYDYHLFSKLKDEKPILIVYEYEDIRIALPLLLRKVFDTPYYDATSVYGYAGPISNNLDESFDNSKFIAELNDFFKTSNIITVFSRLNPFIKHQEVILKNLGEKPSSGDIVAIDLTEDIDIQRSKYSRRTKTHVNKSRRFCTVRSTNDKDEIKEYIEIYYENMNRVNATKSYYFDVEYFYKLIDSPDFESEILVIEHNETNKIIAGAMFIKTNNIVQYHLSGAKDDYLDLTPAKLLIDEMRVKATQEGFSILNLGGGLGGQNDSLFSFKSSFSKNFKAFRVWKYILNQEVYNDLVLKQKVNSEETNFFPLYRHK
ncbi:peptidoglycan bridge formation glycyltransferase FemA/FemB family protein [Flavobacteriaceae bacterium R38]|nr:peptidoglycan bridge formation glycyltransferase FemA/FemB family protein [Flavobacteriaceae bacterium R38]